MQHIIKKLRGMTAARPNRWAFAAVSVALAAGLFYALNAAYINAHIGFSLRPPSTTVGDQPDAPTDNEDAGTARVTPDRLWIPAIGLTDVPVIYVTERNETAYQTALNEGVGHFPGTAVIGQPGNAYLFGHSSDYARSPGKYKTVFALLSKLKPGDRVHASDPSGMLHVYAVTETFVISPDDFTVLDQFDNQKSLLTLQTSWPLGTALKRYIVRAELVAPAASADAATETTTEAAE